MKNGELTAGLSHGPGKVDPCGPCNIKHNKKNLILLIMRIINIMFVFNPFSAPYNYQFNFLIKLFF